VCKGGRGEGVRAKFQTLPVVRPRPISTLAAGARRFRRRRTRRWGAEREFALHHWRHCGTEGVLRLNLILILGKWRPDHTADTAAPPEKKGKEKQLSDSTAWARPAGLGEMNSSRGGGVAGPRGPRRTPYYNQLKIPFRKENVSSRLTYDAGKTGGR